VSLKKWQTDAVTTKLHRKEVSETWSGSCW